MKSNRELFLLKSSRIESWRVFVEKENKLFLKRLIPETGSQGYLFNLFLTRLREECEEKKLLNYTERSYRAGTLEDFLKGLKVTITTK